MARPETTADVKSRWNSVCEISMDELVDKPALLKTVAALMEAVEKAGGNLDKNYTRVSLQLPKTESQLETELESEQRQWDRMNAKYDAALVSVESIEDGELSWEQREIRRWAKEQGRPDPFIVSEIDGVLA